MVWQNLPHTSTPWTSRECRSHGTHWLPMLQRSSRGSEMDPSKHTTSNSPSRSTNWCLCLRRQCRTLVSLLASMNNGASLKSTLMLILLFLSITLSLMPISSPCFKTFSIPSIPIRPPINFKLSIHSPPLHYVPLGWQYAKSFFKWLLYNVCHSDWMKTWSPHALIMDAEN